MTSPDMASAEVGHTPGPWVIRRGHSVVEVRTTAGLEIAATTGGKYWENFSDEALANSRLIAAAPALLEALEYYMSQFGQALEAHGIPLGPNQANADRQARAAIQKARGEQA